MYLHIFIIQTEYLYAFKYNNFLLELALLLLSIPVRIPFSITKKLICS